MVAEEPAKPLATVATGNGGGRGAGETACNGGYWEWWQRSQRNRLQQWRLGMVAAEVLAKPLATVATENGG